MTKWKIILMENDYFSLLESFENVRLTPEPTVIFSEDENSTDSDLSDHYFLEDALISSIRNGEYDQVKEYVRYGADVNYFGPTGHTPLCIAVIYNYLQIVDFLIRNGADVNLPSGNEGYSPLMYSIFVDDIMINLLCYHGANLNFETEIGETPLIIASREDKFLEAETLLKNGANPNYKNKNGHSALFTAHNYNSWETAASLIRWGAHVSNSL